MTGGLETFHTPWFNNYLVQSLPGVLTYGSMARHLEPRGHHCREGTSRWGRVSSVGWESLSGDGPIRGRVRTGEIIVDSAGSSG